MRGRGNDFCSWERRGDEDGQVATMEFRYIFSDTFLGTSEICHPHHDVRMPQIILPILRVILPISDLHGHCLVSTRRLLMADRLPSDCSANIK